MQSEAERQTVRQTEGETERQTQRYRESRRGWGVKRYGVKRF